MTFDEDLATAVDARLERLVELSRLRAEARRATRERLARRRAYGLARRHEQRIERSEET